MAFIGVPIVVLCYLIVNLSYFTVLSYEQLESAEAVGLVHISVMTIIDFSVYPIGFLIINTGVR